MELNKIYTTPEGTKEKVLMVDETNKMVYINTGGSRHRWVHESEYSLWESTDTGLDIPQIYVQDMPSQMAEKQSSSLKNKTKRNKKDKDESN